MCKFCDGEFIGDVPIVQISQEGSGIEAIIEGGFLYLYCKCGVHSVTEIKYCPMCGKKLLED